MKKLVVEALGTGLLAFTAMLSGGNPFAVAAVLAIAILAWGGISGGHFNLSVTTAMWVRKEISCVEAIKYGIAQVVGVVIAFALVNSMQSGALNIVNMGDISIDMNISSMFAEFMAGFVLLIAIFASIRSKVSPAWGVGLAHLVLVPLGFMINTSITLGSFFNGGAIGTVILLAIAQIVGGIAAAKFDEAINKK